MNPTENFDGLHVFGSALIRVAPDVASMQFSVTATQKKPRAAFEDARKRARAVRTFFATAGISEVQSSRISLSQAWDYSEGYSQRSGYTACVTFNLVLDDLDRVEEITCGAVDAGATGIDRVDFQSRQLKEHRSKARKQAVASAQQKAKTYADAAGVQLGQIVAIHDLNPNQLRGAESHVETQFEPENDGEISAFDPGAITIGVAVTLRYSLEQNPVA